MCGGGGDGGGGEGGLRRKASRQLISAPLSSLKGSGPLCGGAFGSLRAAFGFHVDVVSLGVPAKWLWCRGSATSCSALRHGMATKPAPEGSQAGWKERGRPKSCSPGPRHGHWAGKVAWKAPLRKALIEASSLKWRVSWTRAGHPIYLLGNQCEGVRAMPGAVPEMPGSDGRAYKLKTHP